MNNYVIQYYDFQQGKHFEYVAKAQPSLQAAQAAFGDYVRREKKRVKAYAYYIIENQKRKRIFSK